MRSNPDPCDQSINLAPARAARIAVLVVFLVNGIILASWVIHIPTVKAALHLGEGQLGLALLSLSFGALVAMPVAGLLVARHGSRLITAIGMVGALIALPLPVIASNLFLVACALACLGAAVGAMDVAMNSQAVEVEKRLGRPTMSTFHGFWSLGGFVGAIVGGLLLEYGLPPLVHLLIVIAFFGIAASIALYWFVSTPIRKRQNGSDSKPSFARPTGPLVSLGFLAFFALFSEGAMMDWTTVYLANTLQASTTLAAFGFAAFSITMAIGRLSGDPLIARYSAEHVMRASAILAATGMTLAMVVTYPLAVIAGFGCVGLGLSNMIPILFGAAGRTPGINASTAIAAVTTTGYFGLLVGPPVIGFTAELISLRGAFGLVVLGILLVAVGARIVSRHQNAGRA